MKSSLVISGRVAVDSATDELLPPVRERLALIAWITFVSVTWGVVRSEILREGAPDLAGDLTIPLWMKVVFLCMYSLPAIQMARTIPRMYWLLGASVTTGIFPSVPLMPFVREYVHLIIIFVALMALIRGEPILCGFKQSLLVRLFVLYLGLGIVSVVVNQALGGDIWQLKVGVAEFLLYLAFAVVISVLVNYACQDNDLIVVVVDGFVWTALAQAIVAVATIVLVMLTPYTAGNDTVFGLGYYDRMKATFSGPDQAGIFFVASIPLAIWWASRHRHEFARFVVAIYLQLVPWFVVASGSRTGRIALVVAVLGSAWYRTTRKQALAMLPSLAVAFWVGFYFQSLPLAFHVLGDQLMALWNSGLISSVGSQYGLKGHFFADVARQDLLLSSIDWFRHSPLVNQVIGNGLGVSGYSASKFPSPHMTPLVVLIDLGICGLSILCLFIIILCKRLQQVIRAHDNESEMAFAILLAIITASIAGLTWRAQTWGYLLVLYALGVATSCWLARKKHQALHLPPRNG